MGGLYLQPLIIYPLEYTPLHSAAILVPERAKGVSSPLTITWESDRAVPRVDQLLASF